MLIYACLLFAALMLVLTKAPVAWAQQRTGRYDNHDPRAQQRELTGFGARALAAHQNSNEAFPLFAAGVLVSVIVAPGAPIATTLAMIFVLARLGYWGCYLANIALLRSLLWGVGYLVSLALIAMPLWM
ncbi:MAPEG family protein [Cobetia marina]|jgi:uncharacterized MAPEG superfamily protein